MFKYFVKRGGQLLIIKSSREEMEKSLQNAGIS